MALSATKMHDRKRSPTTTTTSAADSVISNGTLGSDERGSDGNDNDDCSSPASTISLVSPDEWFSRFHSLDNFSAQLEDFPDPSSLLSVRDIPVYDASGRSRAFGSLYEPETAAHQRQLIVFVRHFYCGACQAYLKALTRAIPMRDYFTMPTPTSVIIIGCGQPGIIPHYKAFTQCPFTILTDPSRILFKRLGMNVSLNLGRERPEYMKDISTAAWLRGQVSTIRTSLKSPQGIRKRDVFRGGNPMQIGGEFLLEDGRVIWCHRMKNYRDHSEMGVLRRLLALDEWRESEASR